MIQEGANMKLAIAHLRVSKKRKDRRRYGLAAQRRDIIEFAKLHKYKIVGEFVERKSGLSYNRPEIERCLIECKRQNATLLIAKVDRLSRRLLFVATLMENKIPFIAVDKPYADEYDLHMEAANAQRESKLISKRTKAALREAKRRGVKLGTSIYSVLKQRRKAYKLFARKMKPIIRKLESQGFCTIRALTEKLNSRHIKTFLGGNAKWHISTVHTLLKHLN